MFHITGTTEYGAIKITKPSVIFQHGMGGNALGWTTALFPDVVPMAIQIAKMGFDVYMPNNSGVQYSQKHILYSIDQPEFWAMDWEKYGVYDFPACVKAI